MIFGLREVLAFLRMGGRGCKKPLRSSYQAPKKGLRMKEGKRVCKKRNEVLLACIPLLYRNYCITLRSYRGEIR